MTFLPSRARSSISWRREPRGTRNARIGSLRPDRTLAIPLVSGSVRCNGLRHFELHSRMQDVRNAGVFGYSGSCQYSRLCRGVMCTRISLKGA